MNLQDGCLQETDTGEWGMAEAGERHVAVKTEEAPTSDGTAAGGAEVEVESEWSPCTPVSTPDQYNVVNSVFEHLCTTSISKDGPTISPEKLLIFLLEQPQQNILSKSSREGAQQSINSNVSVRSDAMLLPVEPACTP